MLLAGDGPQLARNDTAGWRSAMTLAALDALTELAPVPSNVARRVCRFSRGAKRVPAPSHLLLARYGSHMIGIYLTGVNEDYLSGIYEVRPARIFSAPQFSLAPGAMIESLRWSQQYACGGVDQTNRLSTCANVNLSWGHRSQ